MMNLILAQSARLMAAVSLAGLVAVALPSAAHDSCPGGTDPNPKHPATHPHCAGGDSGGGGGSNEIVGTEFADGDFDGDVITPTCNDPSGSGDGAGTLVGDDGPNVIKGLAGNDCLDGQGGNDNLQGGDGDDWLQGGSGNDVLSPGPGNDLVDAGADDDRILGGGGDTIDGGDGYDWISYNTDQMQLIVNWTGDPIEQVVDGTPFTVPAGAIRDVINANSDTNTDLVSNIEKINGTANDDYFFGSAANDWFGGGRGDDYFEGGDGDDFIGADRGDDLIIGGKGNDDLRGAENSDEFRFHAADFTGSDHDIIEDFNPRADCINLIGITVDDGDISSQSAGGKAKLDSVITISGGTITVLDVTITASDLGCP